jgi:hypothetical protein
VGGWVGGWGVALGGGGAEWVGGWVGCCAEGGGGGWVDEGGGCCARRGGGGGREFRQTRDPLTANSVTLAPTSVTMPTTS